MANNSGWLDPLRSVFGSATSSPTSHEPDLGYALSEAERALIETLPFQRHAVPGDRVFAAWQQLRVAGDGYPIIVGDDESLARLAEGLAFDDRESGEILEAAAALQMPEAMAARRRQEHDEAVDYLRSVGQEPDGEEMDEPPTGDWPAHAPELGVDGPLLAIGVLAQRPLDRANILVIPAASGPEVPAHLRYGNWNECPRAEYHVALLRSWHERYGAELVSMGADTVELRVKRRPASREEALALAREHYAYCNETVDQGTQGLATRAANLMRSDWWFFWWD